ncbi:hypothetical protein PPERSA_00692 [Pseudocohnilembus persalinus]|uniref:RRM domain-containing protein n=1 Tax=Pseudocohnilembus persalinus TaxID=266149 RepID=A0A0V0QSV7_PSEPJ|nr:hypothetical protein PPERSA_00692 [Pseudocohnilembus persalinus]|eukprot:KRX05391.1 hypothetical protein PPERSA_00692 [Pseudocohnilembus persalinus]
MPSWTQEEVVKFFNNSLRFQISGSDMEYFLTQTGFLQQDVSLNDAINLYCEKLNVPQEVQRNMHIIRKNRNLIAHESVQDINKNDVLELDYYDKNQVEQYKKYQETTKQIAESLQILKDKLENDDLLNQQELNKIKEQFEQEQDSQDETETWSRKEVKKLLQNVFRFRTFGLNMEKFLSQVQDLQKNQKNLTIYDGIEDYCETFNVPEKVKGVMHTIRMNRNLAFHEGYQKFDKEDLIGLNYYNSKEVEKYRKYLFLAQNSLKKWKIFIYKKKGMNSQQIAHKIIQEKLNAICAQKSDCRDNTCSKDHPDGKYCELGKNCRNYQCKFQHSSSLDIFVAGLAPNLEEEKIKELFQEKAGPITYLKYSVKNNKGVAFITFKDQNSYQQAFDLNSTSQFDGRKMYVKSSDR